MKKQDFVSKMRHKIIFQSESPSSDSGGGQSISWTNVASVWAQVKPFFSRSTNNERFRAGQIEDRLAFKFTVRYLSGVTPKMRILYGTRVFNIRSVVNIDEKNEFLEILAEEGVAV